MLIVKYKEIDNFLYNKIIETSNITDLLGNYLDSPSIFQSNKLPENLSEVNLPYIYISQNITSNTQDDFTSNYEIITRDIHVVSSAKNLVYDTVYDICDEIHQLFHRKQFDINEYSDESVVSPSQAYITILSTVNLPSDNSLIGVNVTIAINYHKGEN